MGTRNLIAVFSDGEYKVAQYGQWDGYPSGEGVSVLEFLKSADLNQFKEALSSVSFLTESEMEEIDNKYGQEWKKHYPHLSRDTGSEILNAVMNGAKKLKNSIGFSGDSLFCEYAYVIDMDTKTFEVFEGFNKEKISNQRFNSGEPDLEKRDGYEPVIKVKEYSFDSLPSQDEFLSDFTEEE